MPIISLIVPVYKVEVYLERCVKSLVNQSLENIEIILVDDGSPDRSGEICDHLKEKYKCIKVVHKKNGGLSSARNAGLAIANGKYIGFVDSDDDVELDMFEIMVSAAEKNSADFVMSDYVRISRNGDRKLISTKLNEGVYDKSNIKEYIYPSLIMGENIEYGPILSVWHCIYKREFLEKNEITFANDVKWSEDNLFNALVGYCAERFVYLKGKGLYYYYENAGTITTSYRQGAWEIYIKMNDYMKKFFGYCTNYDFKNQISAHLIYYACNVIGMEARNAKNIRGAKREIKKILVDSKLRRAFANYKFPKNMNWKLKVQLYLMKYNCSILSTLLLRMRNR